MIRLPSSHAAITAPLVASSTAFPGIPIGRSLLDGRPFHLSPVLTDDAVLPATNSLALGGLGSGKSTTAKTRIRREILHHGHQAVVIDSFGEDNAGEWAPLVHSLGGQVIKAGTFTLNPCSSLFPSEVREQLVRSLIAAVEPGALTHQATHALQHALNSPKASSLNGLVDALVAPEDGRWPAAKLSDWGEGAAIALSRYTEGSLRGLFDGPDAGLPDTDLPILSFDFTSLDRNSPAIPSLMAAVSCWAEHVWLRQSTAAHRHLVIEEAWQILLSPATSELIQRLLKNSRKAGLSLDVVMHTLSDLGDGKAQDLARLCEVAHIGRLGPEEAAIVGALLSLPAWAIDKIPMLDPGQAVWKVGPDYVDIVQTVISSDEAALTDTSSRRRKAQQAVVLEKRGDQTEAEAAEAAEQGTAETSYAPGLEAPSVGCQGADADADADGEGEWGWELPPNVIDWHHDNRHHEVLQAAREGRFNEAAQLAAIGEREDIHAHGLNSDQATAWLTTRAEVAELSGSADQAARLRATAARLGTHTRADDTGDAAPAWHQTGQTTPLSEPLPPYEPAVATKQGRRRAWPYLAGAAALSVAVAGIWQTAAGDDEARPQDRTKTAAFTGRSGASLTIDGVHAAVVAQWNSDKDRVIIQLKSYFERNARYLRLDGDGGRSASSTRENGQYPKDPEIVVPVDDPMAEVTVRVAIGGRKWKDGDRATSRTIRLSPTGTAHDAESGKALKAD